MPRRFSRDHLTRQEGDHRGRPPPIAPAPFSRSLGIDWEEWDEDDSNEVMESVLQQCTVILPSRTLKWRYRPRHEALIAFSTHYIYGDQLITFPDAWQHNEHMGIKFIYIPVGIHNRGRTRKNRIEAKRVA